MADELTAAEIATLLATIDGSRRRQLERIAAVEAGVRCAAEQVQDVRLRILESPPPFDVSNLLLQAGLTLVFETTILGVISGRAASALLAPLVRMERGATRAVERAARRRRAAAQTEKEASAGDEMRTVWLRTRRDYPRLGASSPQLQQGVSKAEASVAAGKQATEQARAAAQREYLDLAAQAERIASTHSRLRGSANSENVGGGIQASAAAWQAGKGQRGVTPESGLLEPGVMIQHQAAAWASGWRIASDARHDALAQEVRSPGCARKDAEEVLDSLDPTEDLGAALEHLREATATAIEALIWSQLLAGGLPPGPQFDDLARFQPVMPAANALKMMKGMLQGRGTEDAMVKSDLDYRLQDYLASRFGELAGEGPAPAAPGKPDNFGDAMRRGRVLRWLSAVNGRYQRADRQLVSMLGG